MKKRKIVITENLKDDQLFEPAMLISLENQQATHKNLSQKKRVVFAESRQSLASFRSISRKDSSEAQSSVQNIKSNGSILASSDRSIHMPNLTDEDKVKEQTFGSKDQQANEIAPQNSLLSTKNNKLMKKLENLKQSNLKNEKRPSIFGNTTHLNNVLKEQRKKNIQRNFIKKIRKKQISQLQYLECLNKLESQKSFFEIQGIYVSETIQSIFKAFQITFTFILVFINTILMVYPNALEEPVFIIKNLAIIFYAVQFIMKMITIRNVDGKMITKLSQVWKNIGYQQLIIDVVNILVIILDISLDFYAIAFLRLLIMIKLPQVLSNMEQIQIKFITNYENDKYWSLVKIMLLNFCFAHLLAILLTAMAQISPQDNWMTIRNIQDSAWYERYIWAYYWGTNIMLTVGFGDISATNYKEALCLIFIETVSCVVLAYNVSCVGDLIMNIKQKDCQKKNQIKVFRKITENNPVSNELNWKITNFIEQSINLKKNFNYQEEYKFVTDLPKYLKYDFLKQTNKSVFNQLPFFQFMMEKTIYNLAEKIEMLMSHPQQILRNKNDDFNLWILRSGQVGLIYQRPGSDCNGQIIDKIVAKGNDPFILSLNFITKKQLPYQIKSLQYSSFYYLDFQKLMQTLKQNLADFYYYAFLRDKIKNVLDQFEVYKCSLCKDRYHYKFDCPLIHYIPNTDKIIFQELRNTKILKMKNRTPFKRQNVSIQPFQIYKYYRLHKKGQNRGSISDYCQLSNSLLGEQRKTTVKNFKTMVVDEQLSYNNISKSLTAEVEFGDEIRDLKQFISGQLQRVVQAGEECDPVWLIKLDVLMDYNTYFQDENPKNIGSKYAEAKNKKFNRFKMYSKHNK